MCNVHFYLRSKIRRHIGSRQARIQDFNLWVGGAELRPEGPSYESGGEFSHHLGGLEECRQVAKSLTIGYFKHSWYPLLTLHWCYWLLKTASHTQSQACSILLTVAEIGYLGPIPLPPLVQHGASQKLIPDWKHCNMQQLRKGCCTKNYRSPIKLMCSSAHYHVLV